MASQMVSRIRDTDTTNQSQSLNRINATKEYYHRFYSNLAAAIHPVVGKVSIAIPVSNTVAGLQTE